LLLLLLLRCAANVAAALDAAELRLRRRELRWRCGEGMAVAHRPLQRPSALRLRLRLRLRC
jgi:hypothetical protein